MRRAIAIAAILTACATAPEQPANHPAVAVGAATQGQPDPQPAALVPISVADPSDAPPGFPSADEFADLTTACADLVPRLVSREDLRKPVLDWCLVRAHESSRNGRVRSRIDGSWIHDRDRPAARAFYLAGVRAGHLDPERCEHHRVDTSIKRSREASSIVDRWPYATHCDASSGPCRPSSPGRMDPTVARRWLARPPDFERFGTRGPMDNHAATAARYLGGCFGPEQLDRFDVAAAVVILRAVDLCEQLEQHLDTRARRDAAKRAGLPTSCRTHRDIRQIWRPSFWAREITAVRG